MSKLAMIKAYQRDPRYAGDLIGGIMKLFKKGKAAVTKIAGSVAGAAKSAGGAVSQLVEQAAASAGENGGGGGGGGTGRRRRRGITARELSGYRKVANLLHKEGMVSRRSRGRK